MIAWLFTKEARDMSSYLGSIPQNYRKINGFIFRFFSEFLEITVLVMNHVCFRNGVFVFVYKLSYRQPRDPIGIHSYLGDH